jgi:hypothetical protein
MSFPKIKESELKALLDEVATDLSKAFESEKDKLVKAEEVEKSALAKDDAPGEEPDESPAADASAPPDAAPAPSPEEGSESAPAPDASASPDGAPAPDAAMDPAADAAAALTPEALQAEYSKLAPEELDMHIKAALAAKAAVAGAPDASAGAPPMAPPDASAPAGAPPAGPPSPPMPDDPMALKSEISAGSKKASGGQVKAGGSLGKSENEKATDDKIAALEALVKSQGEDNENLAKAIKLMIEQPLRKAVTSVAHLPKVEAEKAPLTKASINARLKELSMKPDLKKSDRALINDFYDGRVKADALAPLFEDYK